MKFSEFKVGMVIKHGPVVVDREQMLDFAKSYDPQWFHVDAERAEEGRWGGLIGSGWLTCSLAMRMAVDAALYDSESFGRSEEHKSELQSLMRISYAVFCFKQKNSHRQAHI